MAQNPEFDPQGINQALEAANRHAQARMPQATNNQTTLDDGKLKVSGGQCISVTVQNSEACLNLPLGIGSVCLPVPSWVPNGTAVQACLDICTTWGIPCGVEVTVSLGGQVIVQKGFGCSC